MRYAFIDAEKATWPVEVQCGVLEVSRSDYYAWKARPASPRALKDAEVVADIKAAHKAGRGTYGVSGRPRTRIIRTRSRRTFCNGTSTSSCRTRRG